MWKTRTKKLASMLLTLLMAVTLLSGTAFAEEKTAETAQELKDAIADGNTITLTANIDLGAEGITIPAGEKVTLKLNGHSLTSTGEDTISVKGTLIVEGEGSVTSTGDGKGALVNYPGGEVELKGGSYNAEEWYTLKNMGNMSIYSGVTVKAETDGSSLIANGWYGGNGDNDRDTEYCANEAILHIYGGHFSGGMNTVKNDDNGVLFIEDGTFENTKDPTILNWNEAEISGGDFSVPSGPVLAYGHLDKPQDKGEFVIKGGTFTSGNGGTEGLFGYGAETTPGGKIEVLDGEFNGLLGEQSNYFSPVTISKGSFNSQVDSSLIEGGKTSASLTSDGDTTFYIGSADEVAETMMAKAQKGDTITVLQGDLQLKDIIPGVTVKNPGAGNVVVNDTQVEANGSITTEKPAEPVKPEKPVRDPDEGKEFGKVEVGGSSTDADTDKENPGTGDNSYVALAMAALLASGVCVVLSQKRKHA